jgi:hypothetical protein
MKPNIRIARGQPTTVDIHVIPRGVKTPLSFKSIKQTLVYFRAAISRASELAAVLTGC